MNSEALSVPEKFAESLGRGGDLASRSLDLLLLRCPVGGLLLACSSLFVAYLYVAVEHKKRYRLNGARFSVNFSFGCFCFVFVVLKKLGVSAFFVCCFIYIKGRGR